MNSTKDKIKFSIVIPTYNSADFISECLSSIFAQTYQNFEIIIIDNFSGDRTLEKIGEFKSKNIQVFQNHNYGVIAVSRNLGISKASGEYIALLDSDDFWYENKLQVCAEYLEKHDIVCHLLDGSHGRKFKHKSQSLTFKKLFMSGNCIATSSVVFKKSLVHNIGTFSEDRGLNTAEDYDYWLKILYNNITIYMINWPLGFYRRHKNNTSNYENYSASINILINKWRSLVPKRFLFVRKGLLLWELLKLKLGA